jgi:hypothetical protein
LGISRTNFALTIGVGSERLASYEAGRSPLKYEIFRSITAKFYLLPGWLATGYGFARDSVPFDDSDFKEAINARLPFTTVYDSVLSGTLASSGYEWLREMKRSEDDFERLMRFVESRDPEKETSDPTILPIVEQLAAKLTQKKKRIDVLLSRYKQARKMAESSNKSPVGTRPKTRLDKG